MKVRIYLVLMVAAILVPVIVFSAVALNLLLRAEREAALSGVRQAARATALAVDRDLDKAQTALRVLGTSHYLSVGDWESFYKQALVADSRKGSWVVLFDRDGRQIINTRVPFGTPLPTTNPEPVRRVMETQTPQATNLLQGAVTGQHVVATGFPVPFGDGKRYVLAHTFLANHFDGAFTQRSMPASWIIGIFDREGRTIARSHGAQEYVGKRVRPEIFEAARAANEGVLRNRTRDGVDIYTVFTHSELAGWGVAVGVPVEEIESAARRAVVVAGIGLLAVFACAAGVGVFLARRLSRSIGGAVRSATALGRGEVPASASTGVAELDKLHSALAEAGEVVRKRAGGAQAGGGAE